MKNTIDLISQYHNAVMEALFLLHGNNMQDTKAYKMLNELAKQEGALYDAAEKELITNRKENYVK
jgi:hypothetical protein